MPEKASIALAIIARNAGKTLGACLDSIAPYVQQTVVCVDETTTDDTAQVAQDHGAEVHTIRVSDWHECPRHGRVLVQDFARARDKSFMRLRKDVDWWMWIDADDVVKGADKLADYLSKAPPTVEGIWLPYAYAHTPENRVTTLFDRERILRSSLNWKWDHPVHEVALVPGRDQAKMEWDRNTDIVIWHQGEGHDTSGSARRNLLILEIVLEQNPNDQWALFYLGNQYFALSQWSEAIECYERATQNDNAYQVWQTLIYLSMAYEKMGDIDSSAGAAFRAIDLIPGHPEPYYRLGVVYTAKGDDKRAEFWIKFGDRLGPPPGFVFQNPLDKPYNARVTLGQAYGNAGRIPEALQQLEMADSVSNSPAVKEGIEYYRKIQHNTQEAQALSTVLRAQNGNIPDLWERLNPPPDVRAFGRVRDVVMPALLKNRPMTQPRMILWCGMSAEHWYPGSIDTTGIGGSETAVIEIARRLSKSGWRVDVYNAPERWEGVYDGVGYWELNRLGKNEHAEVLVSWRRPQDIDLSVKVRKRILWCHDLHYGPGAGKDLSKWDAIWGVSTWHADYLAMLYDLTNTDFVPNGINLSRFAEKVEKTPFRCVYASSPDRGLGRLLSIWPYIVQQEPTAELHIAYGWQTIDHYIAMGNHALVEAKKQLTAMIEKSPNVVWRDRLPQNKLAKLYQESYCWTYPTDFLEVSCISAMEAMAGGAVPLVSSVGALPETLGVDGGLIVKGNVYTPAWREYYGYLLRGLLVDRRQRQERSGKARERAKSYTWDNSYLRWTMLLERLLVEKEEREVALTV